MWKGSRMVLVWSLVVGALLLAGLGVLLLRAGRD
jgi:hypothetical protein